MLLTLIGPATLIAPAPVAPNIAPSPAPLFHAAPAQFRLEVSHTMLDAPLSQFLSPARALRTTPAVAALRIASVRPVLFMRCKMEVIRVLPLRQLKVGLATAPSAPRGNISMFTRFSKWKIFWTFKMRWNPLHSHRGNHFYD